MTISNGSIPLDLIKEVSEVITDYYYEQYTRFLKRYPKSAKRYCTFDTKDLNHPSTFEIIIKYFKNKTGNNYLYFCKSLMNMSEEETIKFEMDREAFYRMW